MNAQATRSGDMVRSWSRRVKTILVNASLTLHPTNTVSANSWEHSIVTHAVSAGGEAVMRRRANATAYPDKWLTSYWIGGSLGVSFMTDSSIKVSLSVSRLSSSVSCTFQWFPIISIHRRHVKSRQNCGINPRRNPRTLRPRRLGRSKQLDSMTAIRRQHRRSER